MGASLVIPVAAPQVSKVHVTLHIYDAMIRADLIACNRALLKLVGAGAFHCGVEVHSREWSYRKTRAQGTGVFCHAPLKPPGGSHLKSINMGTTELQAERLYRLIAALAWEWQGTEYDLLERNCVHFCQELCRRLCVAVPFPPWVSKLSDTGRSIRNDGRNAAEAMADCHKAVTTKVQTAKWCLGDDGCLCCMESLQGDARALSSKSRNVRRKGSTVEIIQDSRLVTSMKPAFESSAGIIGL